MIATLFASTCAKVAGALGLVSIIVIAILWGSLSAANNRADNLRDQLAKERANHAVTEQSLDTLEGVIDNIKAEAMERAAAFELSKAEAEKREAELREQGKASEARIAALRRIAEQDGPGCPVPDELRRLVEGL